jgi:steroid delta-isomerase-like uncharacterized protein
MTKSTESIEQMVEGFSTGDLDKVLSVFDEDILYEDVPFGVRVQGKSAVSGFCRSFMDSMPDFRQELTFCFRQDNIGVTEWVMSFTQTGDLPGMPATGKRATVRGMAMIELRGDLIVRSSSYYDVASVMRQLGHLPARDPHPE